MRIVLLNYRWITTYTRWICQSNYFWSLSIYSSKFCMRTASQFCKFMPQLDSMEYFHLLMKYSRCQFNWRARICMSVAQYTHRLIFRQLNLITVYFMKHYIRMLSKDLISCLQLTTCFYALANISICIFSMERREILCLKRWFEIGSLVLSTTTF